VSSAKVAALSAKSLRAIADRVEKGDVLSRHLEAHFEVGEDWHTVSVSVPESVLDAGVSA
jgi:hypothetical protein